MSASTRVLDEFYRVAFRKKLYASIEDLENYLDLWIKSYNEDRPPRALVLRQSTAANFP